MPASLQHAVPSPVRRNLELKVRVPEGGLDRLRDRLAGWVDGPPEHQQQHDVYFRVPEGRLKLRTIGYGTGESRAELIAYQRPNLDGSRRSSYRITALEHTQASELSATLAQVLPILVEVRKDREIYHRGATRIHLDTVDELGQFVELETVIGKQGDDRGESEHRHVIDYLGLDEWPVQAGSYSDLLRDSGS